MLRLVLHGEAVNQFLPCQAGPVNAYLSFLMNLMHLIWSFSREEGGEGQEDADTGSYRKELASASGRDRPAVTASFLLSFLGLQGRKEGKRMLLRGA
jgi:hypothetical protein